MRAERRADTLVYHQIAFFDIDKNSTGHLTAEVTDLAVKVAGLFGITGCARHV